MNALMVPSFPSLIDQRRTRRRVEPIPLSSMSCRMCSPRQQPGPSAEGLPFAPSAHWRTDREQAAIGAADYRAGLPSLASSVEDGEPTPPAPAVVLVPQSLGSQARLRTFGQGAPLTGGQCVNDRP
jgi:hypothetical protein